MGILIFISYVVKDTKYFKIREIAERLTEYSEIDNALYCEKDVDDDFVEYMNKNLEKCDIVLLFCSENLPYSEHTNNEWKTTLCIRKPIIPVFKKVDYIPTLLKRLLGVRFNKQDIDQTVEDIYQLILKKIKLLSMAEKIQVYDKSMKKREIKTRKEIHEIHEVPLWHKTCIIIVVHPNGKVLYIKRSEHSRINPKLYDCFGGHLEVKEESEESETYLEAGRRELTEELGLPLEAINEEDLIQIGEEGKFKARKKYPPKYQNYEFSTCYLYFSKEEFILNVQELFGNKREPLKLKGDFFDDLIMKFKDNPCKFADGISRILKNKKAVDKIREEINNHFKDSKQEYIISQ